MPLPVASTVRLRGPQGTLWLSGQPQVHRGHRALCLGEGVCVENM